MKQRTKKKTYIYPTVGDKPVDSAVVTGTKMFGVSQFFQNKDYKITLCLELGNKT